MALAGQILNGLIHAGILSQNGFVPHGEEVGSLGGGQELIGDDVALPAVVIVAPLDIGLGAGSDAADGVGAALGGVGDHDCGIQQSSLGLSEENESLVNGLGSLGGFHQRGVVAQNELVDFFFVLALVGALTKGQILGRIVLGGLGGIGGLSGLGGLGGLSGIGGLSGLSGLSAAGSQSEDHRQRQGQRQQAGEFLAHCSFPPNNVVHTVVYASGE